VDRDTPMDLPDAGSMAFDSATAEVPGSSIDPDLVLWYPFDETSGSIAYDMAQFGGVARNATLVTAGSGGSAMFSSARRVGTHALALSPGANASSGGGYVVIPALNTLAPGAVTIAVWVNLAAATSNQAWERIYDFGDSTTAPAWLNLTARNQANPFGPIFNMSKTGHATPDQQKLTGSTALTSNTWHHIAVVLPADATFTGVMYLDGAVAATNNAMTVHFSDIGATANNWLGRSEFTNDPYFNGSLDDFRVYRRDLSQQEVQALMALR
ncbi:MAG TPA: LamG domain-containing protein, partial [Polyangia bacterium]